MIGTNIGWFQICLGAQWWEYYGIATSGGVLMVLSRYYGDNGGLSRDIRITWGLSS
jgi:hypothetical protein